MDLSGTGLMDNFTALDWVVALPLAVPLGFVLPPWIAVLSTVMCPMMQLDRAAFRNSRIATHFASATTSREGFGSLTIDNR